MLVTVFLAPAHHPARFRQPAALSLRRLWPGVGLGRFRPTFPVVVAGALFGWLSVLGLIVPYDPDEAVYKVVATGIIDGQWPYRDLFDHKPPLVYAWYLPAGLGASIEVERILAALMLAVSVVLLARIARGLLSPREANIATVAYALLLASPIIAVGANTEAFMMAPLLGAVLVTSPLAAGVLLGIAVATKPVALAYVPLIFMMRRQRSWRVAAGAAATLVAISLPFIPVWRAYLEANVMFNLTYGAGLPPAERLRDLVTFNPFVLIAGLPIWIAAASGALTRRHKLLLLWAAAGFAAAKATGRDYGYYYVPLLPAAALLAAQGFDSLLRPGTARTLAAAAAAVSVTAGAIAMWIGWRVGEQWEPMAAAVSASPGEAYVLGDDVRIYAYAARQPSRRFFYSVPLFSRPPWGEATRAALLACPPRTLVVPRDPQTPFPVAWSAELESLYARRTTYTTGALLTEPRIACAPAGPEQQG